MSHDPFAGPPPPEPQTIAGAALSILSPSTTTFSPRQTAEGANGTITATTAPAEQGQHAGNTRPAAPSIPVDPSLLALTGVTERTRASGAALVSPEGCAPVQAEGDIPKTRPAATSHTLPSLLRYVDHDLMQNATLHNHPPHPNATCLVCFSQWDTPNMPIADTTGLPSHTPQPTYQANSTFLPLSPCGHWIHYRCLIRLTTQPSNDGKDKCFICHRQLFEWDGITALTLATRTGLELEDEHKGGYYHPGTRVWTPSDKAEYESDCALIDAVISQQFFRHLSIPSQFNDGSPDLIRAYTDVLDELDRLNKPRAKWLSWTTHMGFLLLGMLVALKMRRFLVEKHGNIRQTEAWRHFEDGAKTLQGRILEEVHKPE